MAFFLRGQVQADGTAGVHGVIGVKVILEHPEHPVLLLADVALQPGGKHLADAVMMADGRAGFLDGIQNGGVVALKFSGIVHPGDEDEVQVCIISQDNVEDVIARGDGVQDTLEKECPNVNVVTRQAGDTPEGGLEIVESALAAYPDLKVVVATNDSGGIGGYQALVNAGYTGSDPVAVFSGDATDEALNDMLQDDTIYRGTVDLAPYACGYESAYQLVYYCMNGKPAETKTQGFTPVMVPLADLLDGTYAYDPK